MGIYDKLRRTIVNEGFVYKFNELFEVINEDAEIGKDIDNPKFYDTNTGTLRLDALCARDIEENYPLTIEMGGRRYSTYCALYQVNTNLPSQLKKTFSDNINKLYNFLRRGLKIDNRHKFHGLLKVILGYNDPANTLNIIIDFIENPETDSNISKALDSFRSFGDEVSEDELEEFLRNIKFTSYTKYEKSFHGDHFSKHTTSLVLNYKDEKDKTTLYHRILSILDNTDTIEGVVEKMYDTIVKNLTQINQNKLIKADLKVKNPLYQNEKGRQKDVILNAGDFIEVKKIDYSLDSYLSEFIAIYKNQKNYEYDITEPKFLEIYNSVIDSLFLKLSSDNKLIERIKFSGVLYDGNILVTRDNIELYWSNQGRSPCTKDHRLSIRYRIKNPVITGYFYNGTDVLVPKKGIYVTGNEKFICPLIRPKNINESNKGELIIEGRVSDAKKKFKETSDEIFNYYVENDPSGNQKYLDFLLTYTPKDYKKVGGLQTAFIDLVTFFHQYQNMYTIKDINQHTVNSLMYHTKIVKSKLEDKLEKKHAKKEKTVVYEDNRWLVVAPHSWKASCYYGMGTKWCISMRETESYWQKYDKDSTFFFVIDKTKATFNQMYKIAYRLIGPRGTVEIWDAEDMNITFNRGVEWEEQLPSQLRERIMEYHKNRVSSGYFDKIEKTPQVQALSNLHINEIFIENVDDYWYELPIYKVGDVYMCVASKNEFTTILKDEFNDYWPNLAPYGYNMSKDDNGDTWYIFRIDY
jgi:hypothetical protein